MSLYNLPNITDGLDEALVGLASQQNSYIPFIEMFLVFVFGLVFIGGFTSQKKRSGYGDLAMWSVIASISMLMVALPMTLTSGIISIQTLTIVVVVNILSAFWLFTSKNKNEV